MKDRDGGPAFPNIVTANSQNDRAGMSLRDYFAIHAPEPSEDDVKMQRQFDRNRNPHNDSHKPPIREHRQIVADLRYAYADAMLTARSKP